MDRHSDRERREDYRAAVLTCTFINMNRDPKSDPANLWDVFPSLEYLKPKPREVTVADHRSAAEAWVAGGYGTFEVLTDVEIIPAQPVQPPAPPALNQE